MPKVRKIETRKMKIAEPWLIDDTARRYLDALHHAEVLKKALLDLCRSHGFTPKDAPKTKMLAGDLFEVLASRATRTDVDQKRAERLHEFLKLRGPATFFGKVFDKRIIYDLKDDWERGTHGFWGHNSARLRKAVMICLSQRSSHRLTVRKRKSATEAQRRREKKAA